MSTGIKRALKIYAPILLLLALVLAGCGSPAAPTQVAVADTAAPPADTPVPPTATPKPTDTLVPPTETPKPTDTPVPPTETPKPTDTPAPPTETAEPTEEPATATPEPEEVASPAEEHLEQGVAYFEAEKWDKAIAEFEEAIQLDPKLGDAYGWLAYAYINGPGDLEKAVANLEMYLKLVPDAEDKAQMEADLKDLKQVIAEASQAEAAPTEAAPAEASAGYDVPAGKALFVFTNYTDVDWSIDIGSYHLDMPAWKGGDYPVGQVVIDPGKYAWQALSPGGGYYITDANNNRSFEFTVAAGEVYETAVGGPPR